MTTLKERRLYQQIILSRSKNPRYFGQANPIHRSKKLQNPYCGDTIETTITINKQDNKLQELKFRGSGCALCLASADLMAETLTGKTIAEAENIVEHFHQVMLGQAELATSLDRLKAVEGVKRYPLKIKCVTLAWHTLKMAISD